MNKLEQQDVRVSPKRTLEPIRHLTAQDILSVDAGTSESGIRLPIEELLVEGLLSFGEKTQFEFGRLNILVGPNGSGKSNLIDCIRVFRYAWLDIQEPFSDIGFEEWLYKGNTSPSNAFLQVTSWVPEVQNKIRHQLRLGPPLRSQARLEEEISMIEVEGEQPQQIFAGSYRSEATLSVPGAGKRRRQRKLRENEYSPFASILSQIRDMGQAPEITRLANLYSGFRIYSEWSFGRKSPLREANPVGRADTIPSEAMNDLALTLNVLQDTPAHDKIRILLRELKATYRDYITRIVFGRVGLEFMEAPFTSPLSSYRLSDGTLRFLALAVILLQPSPPSLICLEEPELGMHPDMIHMVAKMIVDASIKTQLIVATHSEHLLTALQDDFDALFTFDAGPAGSVVSRLSRQEYLEWRADHNLGQLWSSGEIGGVRY